MAADVAGYSRLTGADEEGTLARLRALREALIDPGLGARSPTTTQCCRQNGAATPPIRHPQPDFRLHLHNAGGCLRA